MRQYATLDDDGYVPLSQLRYSSYRSLMLDLSPIAYWRLGEASGTDAADVMGVHAATYVGSPTLSVAGALSGDANTAVSFAVDQNVTGPDLGITGAHSALMWFKRLGNPASGTQHQLLRRQGGNNADIVYLNAAGTYLIVILADAGGVSRAAEGAVAFGDGAWHLVGYTFDGSQIQRYVDGAAAGAAAPCVGLASGTGTVRIGAETGSGTFQANFTSDEPAIWSRALTASEIVRLYEAGT